MRDRKPQLALSSVQSWANSATNYLRMNVISTTGIRTQGNNLPSAKCPVISFHHIAQIRRLGTAEVVAKVPLRVEHES